MSAQHPNGKKETERLSVHDAAHDLNNVMMTIAGSAELLLESAGENQQLKHWAERILRASREGMALVDSLKTPPKGPVRSNDSFGQGKVPA